MSDFIDFIGTCFLPANMPFTVLLILVFIYWLMIIVGAIGLDTFDLSADTDVQVDCGMSTGMAALKFFHIGEVPVMIVASVFVFSLWAVALLSNEYFGERFGVLVTLVFLVPNIIVSLFVAKIVTIPFRFMMSHVNDGIEQKMQIVGKTCIITTSEVTVAHGQAEFASDGAPLLLNVRTKQGETLARGDEALILDHDQRENVYTVMKFDLDV